MSRPDPHIIGLCPSTSYLLQMYIKSRMNKQPEKKTTVFTKKICKFKTSYYLCNTKFQRWIHLRVRIRASHARHRGSNPLSTTKRSVSGRFFCAQLRVGAESFAGIPRGFSFRIVSRAGFSPLSTVLGWRVLPDGVCFQLPAVAMCRMFSNAAAVPKRTAAAALKLKVI